MAVPAPTTVDGAPEAAAGGGSGAVIVLDVPPATRSTVDMDGWPFSSRPGGDFRPLNEPDRPPPPPPRGAVGWSDSIQGLQAAGRDENG